MAAAIPWASHKDCKIAMGKQSARDVAATTYYLLPTAPDEQELDFDPDYNDFQFGSGYRGLTHYETKGGQINGKMMIPLVPGYTGTGDIFDIIWGRAAAPYFQSYWATVYVAIGDPAASNYRVEKWLNIRVAGGSVPVDFGMDFAKVICNLQGIDLPTTSDPFPAVDTSLFDTAPYRYPEVGIALDAAAEVYTRNHNLEFDNKLEAQELLNGTTLPTDIPAVEWADWKGSFDRPWVDATIRAAFLAGTEAAYELTFTRGGSVATFSMGRILYKKAPFNPGTSGVVKQNGIGFQAYCDLTDDTVQPCEVSEVVGS